MASSPSPGRRPFLARGVELRGPVVAAEDVVLTPEAVAFVADLQRRFGVRREELLARRRELQGRFDRGERPHFLTETADVREREWTVAPIPRDLEDRRVELVGPPDRDTIAGALASGACVFVADFEDSTSPTWTNLVEGQANVRDAVRRTAAFQAPGGRPASIALMCRPRGLHLPEKHLLVDGRPVSASLLDLGLYLFHNARELLAAGSGPYLYLPKLESHLEARLWNDVFVAAQAALGVARGSIRATCLVEVLTAAFEMDEILWELREHAAGLSCGRWDYVFSFVKKLGLDPATVVPDRDHLTMDAGFLDACARLLVRTCHRRGAHAIGGVTGQIPTEGDRAAREAALAEVRADKEREARAGHDGTWVAHPALVPVAKEVFDRAMRGPNQLHVKRDDVRIGPRELLAAPAGARTRAGLRRSIRIGVQYLEAWLRGEGSVPIYGRVEDTGTVEIARAQVWQWIHHAAPLDDGTAVTAAAFRRILDEELERIRLELGDAAFARGKFEEARALFDRMSTAAGFVEFLTLPAYDLLVGERLGIVPACVSGVEPPAPAHPDPNRWEGVVRPYARSDVERLRGSVRIEHTLARIGAERLWELLRTRPYVAALGALTGEQAVQMAQAGLEALHVSGAQLDCEPVAEIVRRMNRALERADRIAHAAGRGGARAFPPIVAAPGAAPGPLDAFELATAAIEAGAAAVELADGVAREGPLGPPGGKVLVPTSQFVRTLVAARLAADVLDVPTLIVARTDADAARLLLSDVDPCDAPFVERGKPRTPEGFFRLRAGVECAIQRALAYAPYADVLWCETSTPHLDEARRLAEAVHARFPGKLLAYDCSGSFDPRRNDDESTIARFHRELGALGYRLQVVTHAGAHALRHATFALARDCRERGLAAYGELQGRERADEADRHAVAPRGAEARAGYLDHVAHAIAGRPATLAVEGAAEASPDAGEPERVSAA
jgi:malate synthase A